MNKRILILTIIGLFFVFGFVLLAYQNSNHKVTFDTKGEDYTIKIYKGEDIAANNTEVATLTDTKEIELRDGKYSYLPIGNNIAFEVYSLTVGGKDQIVVVEPNYSKTYLLQLLEKEQPAARKVIQETYPELIKKYTITQDTLYNRADWYGAVIIPKINDPNALKDAYRVVMHKTEGYWKIVRYPEIILSYFNYPEVPKEIIELINKIQHD